MKKLIAMAALVLALPMVAAAQDAPRPQGGPGRGQMMQGSVDYLVKAKSEWNASDEQIAKLEAILKKFNDETAKLREESQKIRQEIQDGGDRQAAMQKMRPIREEIQKKDDAAVEEALKVLNEEQQKTAKQLLSARREEMNNRRPGRPNGAAIRQ